MGIEERTLQSRERRASIQIHVTLWRNAENEWNFQIKQLLCFYSTFHQNRGHHPYHQSFAKHKTFYAYPSVCDGWLWTTVKKTKAHSLSFNFFLQSSNTIYGTDWFFYITHHLIHEVFWSWNMDRTLDWLDFQNRLMVPNEGLAEEDCNVQLVWILIWVVWLNPEAKHVSVTAFTVLSISTILCEGDAQVRNLYKTGIEPLC